MTENNSRIMFDLLDLGFKRNQWNTVFSDGTKANNKLELDYDTLSQDSKLLGEVVVGLCEIIKPYDADFVVGIPDGASGLAHEVAEELDIYNLILKKDKDTKTFDFASKEGGEKLQTLDRGALIDDVLRTGSNFAKALEVEGMDEKIVTSIAIFDRGNQAYREKKPLINKPTHSLVSVYIHPMLSRHSLLGRK